MYYVYCLKCGDGFYTGCTGDLKERVRRHMIGQVEATRERAPVSLIWYCGFTEKYKAYAFEKYLKSGSGRAFLKRHI